MLIIKKINHNGYDIYHYIGYTFIKFILNEDTDLIIEFVKKTIDKYI